MKKAFAIVFLVAGLGLALTAITNVIDYPSKSREIESQAAEARGYEQSEDPRDARHVERARQEVRDARKEASDTFSNALLFGISGFIAIALAVILWMLHRRGLRARLA